MSMKWEIHSLAIYLLSPYRLGFWCGERAVDRIQKNTLPSRRETDDSKRGNTLLGYEFLKVESDGDKGGCALSVD